MFYSIVYTRGRERSRVVSLKIRFGLVFREKSQLTPQLPSLFFSFSVRTIMTVKSDIFIHSQLPNVFFSFSLRTIMNVKSDISIHRSTTVCVYFWGFRLPIKNWDTWILHFEKVINFAILLNLYVQCEELSKVSICFRLPLCPCHSRQNILFQ